MCRRIITHRMHHDVAAPMIMDPVSPDPVIYANPLRTNFHKCELTHPHPHWLLNTPMLKCPYHTCCVPSEQVEYCSDFLAYLGSSDSGSESGFDYDFEPEECGEFILEHHHERLPYFGDVPDCYDVVPATWRDMVKIRGSDDVADWFPDFAHGAKYRAMWEEACFEACEKLYVLEQDTAMLYASMQDLQAKGPPYSWSTVRAARANVLKVEGELHKQRKLVFDVFEWATEPCPSCDSKKYARFW